MSLVLKLLRNLRLLRALFGFASASDPARRREFIEAIDEWVAVRRGWNLLEARNQDIVGYPRDLLERANVFTDHLRTTPHLGLLQDLERHHVSRFDYVSLQCSIALEIKKSLPGLGLNSRGGTDSSPIIDGKFLTGLEVLQLWSVVTNVGHLFGTFATERALRFAIHRNPGALKEIVTSVNPALQEAVLRLLRGNSMYKFVHVLALWRISNEPTLNEADRGACLQAYHLYLHPKPTGRLARLRRLFNLSRRLAYLNLHSRLEVGGRKRYFYWYDVLRELIDHGRIEFEGNAVEDTPAGRMLAAVDAYQYETFFTGPEVAAKVLNHLREFKKWWAITPEMTIGDRIEALLKKPDTWSPLSTARLEPFLRLELPLSESRWIAEVENWWQAGAAWTEDTNFYVSCKPQASSLFVDIYGDLARRERTAWHISRVLAEHCRKSWRGRNPRNRILWKSIAAFAGELANRMLNPAFDLRVRPLAAEHDSHGFAAASADVVALRERVIAFCSQVQSEIRKQELEALADVMASWDPVPDEVLFAFLGQVLVIERESGEIVQELDIVVGRLLPTGQEWLFGEVKSGMRRGTARQLMSLQSILAHEPEREFEISTPRSKVACVQIRTPTSSRRVA